MGDDLRGLCGNCNGGQDDLRTKNGTDVSRDSNKHNLIGLSYSVVDDSDSVTVDCTPPSHPPKHCSPELTQALTDDDMCGMIKDTAGPFRECILAGVVDVEQYFDTCQYDICAYDGTDGMSTDELVCDALSSFAALCNNYGYQIVWRTQEMCSLPCGPNEVYSPAVNPCPETCNGQLTGSACNGPRVEGCQCKPGFVMSDNMCVPKAQCGCKDEQGNYYPIGAEFRGTDCSTVYVCKNVGGTAKLVAEASGEKCHKDAVCAVKNGDMGCVCKEGYLGDGVESCVVIKPAPRAAPPCEVAADVGIIMDSSTSIGKKKYEVVKGFVKDVVTNFDISPYKVRVAVVTYNTQANLQFNFDAFEDKPQVSSAIENIYAIGYGTYTDRALEMAREEVFSTARTGVPKIAIVITDGRSRLTRRTRKQAKFLRNSGVTVFCIGIGNVSQREIERISSSPNEDFTFLVDNFQALEKIKETVKRAACEATKQ